tara:strand:- start:2651 stop:3283 length:633 start_codon:yes stop_codon:yes gene_type:complete
MEKKLRSELLDLCHSIIADDREEDLVSTLTQTQMLYEKLVVLNYLQEQGENQDENETPIAFNSEEDSIPSSPLSIEKSPQEEVPSSTEGQTVELQQSLEKDIPKAEENQEISLDPNINSLGNNNLSINEQMASGLLKIGLNDRIAFVKHLFNGEQQDYNRVLSNLNTMSNFEEADNFINQIIRPEYKWQDKEEYVDRLMELIRLKFGIES